MTEKRRREIFSQEVITTGDIAEMFGVCPSTASQKMQEIKRHGDRLGIKGKIHIEDYINWVHPADIGRYINGEVAV